MVMQLLNYALGGDHDARLIGLGHHWDLRKAATFTGFGQDASDRSAVLGFMAGVIEAPWGDPGNTWVGLSLRFDDVESFEVRTEASIGAHDRVLSLALCEPTSEALRIELASGTVFTIHAGSSRLIPRGRRDLAAMSARPRRAPGLSGK